MQRLLRTHAHEDLPATGDVKEVFTLGTTVADLDEVPPQVTTEFDVTREEWLELTPAQQSKLLRIAEDITNASNGLAWDPDGAEFVVRSSTGEGYAVNSTLNP